MPNYTTTTFGNHGVACHGDRISMMIAGVLYAGVVQTCSSSAVLTADFAGDPNIGIDPIEVGSGLAWDNEATDDTKFTRLDTVREGYFVFLD